jgi:hypothetical protein
MTLYTDDTIPYTLPITDLPIICWRNVVTVANVSTDTEDPDFPVTNVANSSLGLKWKQDLTGSPAAIPDYITVNASGAGPINYVGIAGHNFGTIGASVAVEGSSGAGAGSPVHEDSPAESEYVTGIVPEDDGPIIFMFAEVEGATIRLRIENSVGTTAAELAVLYVGKCTVMPEGIQADHTPLPLAKRNDTVIGQSENGSFLGRIVLGSWVESSATFSHMTKADIRGDADHEGLLDFLDFASEFPFFYAWSPDTYPEETAFSFLSNDPVPVFDIDGYASIDLDMKGIIE